MSKLKKKTPYLDFYNKTMKKGKMECLGLCNSLKNITITEVDYLYLFNPITEDKINCIGRGESWVYWAYGEKVSNTKANRERREHDFTPLRQTIVLLIAAMNNEL